MSKRVVDNESGHPYMSMTDAEILADLIDAAIKQSNNTIAHARGVKDAALLKRHTDVADRLRGLRATVLVGSVQDHSDD